jgi:hypothetical protein
MGILLLVGNHLYGARIAFTQNHSLKAINVTLTRKMNPVARGHTIQISSALTENAKKPKGNFYEEGDMGCLTVKR